MSSACERVSETQESAIDAEAQSRRSMAMIGDDWQRRYRRFNQTTGTPQLTTKQRGEPADAEAGAEVDEKAEIDSIDSLICACDSPILMRVFRRTRGDCSESARRCRLKDNDSRKMAYIKGGKPRNETSG
jgi:hypothetical protein